MTRYIGSLYRYYDSRLRHVPSHHIRKFAYRYIYGLQLDEDVVIYYGAEFRSPNNIHIGKGTVIGDNAILDGRNGITIGKYVNFSSNVSIWTEQHDHRDPYFRTETQEKHPVVIGDRAWLGPNTLILHSVTIGEGAVVAAGSIVTKSVEPYTIVAGVPAKKIGMRNTDLRYEFDGSYCAYI